MAEMMIAAAILIWIGGFFLGVFTLLGYMIWRLMRSDGWDDSNLNNALRLLSHVVLHPEDFGKMWYVERSDDGEIVEYARPFWYIREDEFNGVVKSRPEK